MKRIIRLLPCFLLICFSELKAQPEANFDLAQSQYSKQNYKQAEIYYTRYKQTIEPKLADYLKTLAAYDTASAYDKLNKYSSFTVNRKWAVAYYQSGVCNLNLNDIARATKDFETSIKIDPGYGPPYLQKGLLIKGTDKTAACLLISKAKWLCDTLKAAKVAYVDNFCWMCAHDLYLKGKTQVELKQFEDGLQNLNKAITFSHDSANYFAYRGIAYEGLGKMDSAIADYTMAIKLDTNSYMGYYRRGLVYEAAQKYKEAFNDFTKVISLSPKYVDAYVHRADDCDNLGMESSMIYDYEQVLKLKPNEGIAYYKLGLHKKKLGQDACDYFQKALDLGIDDAQGNVDECNKAAEKKNLK